MKRRISGTIQYYGWRGATAVLSRTPIRVSYAFAVVIGSVAFYCWPRARRAMSANYGRVMPEASKAKRRAVARRSLVNYCKYLADFVRFPALPPAEVLADVEGDEEFAMLDQALSKGKGAVVVCMHYGNWDLGAGATAARGYPLTVVAETFSDRRLDAMVAGARERLGMKIVKMERLGPSLFRVLKNNELLALLIDRSVPGEGVEVEFFGEKVEVPAGPARLALRTGAAVVPTAFRRKSPREAMVVTKCDFTIDSTPTGDMDADIQRLTQEIVKAHEQFIRERPDQWYMFRPMWNGANPGGRA
ncbi:MAG: lysophospholipid acyltransferase family protein [Dehalococcoidia bacterium]